MLGIRVENLEKFYGSFRALKGISFSVRKGEIVGLLGPNGAGKTTTLRIVATYLLPSGGKVEIAGIDAVKDPIAAREKIGYMPENPPMYPRMRVRDFLKFVARIRGISKKKKLAERLDYVRQVCKLEEVWNKYIAQISKGYRQRVGFAAAIISDPPVLVLDEPTAGLDPEQIRYTRQMIKILGEDHAVLLSTHILHEAQQICDRVEIIHRGQIIASGTPAELSAKIPRARSVKVSLSGPENEVLAALREIDGVLAVKRTEFAKTFLVEFEPRWNVPESISATASQMGWHIIQLTPEEISLEEVFHYLVAGEGKNEANRDTYGKRTG